MNIKRFRVLFANNVRSSRARLRGGRIFETQGLPYAAERIPVLLDTSRFRYATKSVDKNAKIWSSVVNVQRFIFVLPQKRDLGQCVHTSVED